MAAVTICSDFEAQEMLLLTVSIVFPSIWHEVIEQAAGTLKRRQEEPPHIRGQGQKPGGPHAQRAAAKRSYPTSEVRGSGREYQTATAQEWPRGATPCPRSGGRPRGDTQRPRSGEARRGYPVSASEVRGGDGRGYPMPLSPRPGAAGRRISYPTPLSPRPGAAAQRSNPTPESRSSGREHQPHVQGALAARVQEGLEELSHIEGQEGQRWGDTPPPR